MVVTMIIAKILSNITSAAKSHCLAQHATMLVKKSIDNIIIATVSTANLIPETSNTNYQ